jgi:hypothetical protein
VIKKTAEERRMKMKGKKLLVFSIVFVMCVLAEADSWTISTHYLRLNQANPSGNTDNIGVAVSYDWLLNPCLTFGVEALGSWDNPAELYGGGINMKYNLASEGLTPYCGGYVDYIHATSLPSKAQGGSGDSEDGYIYGPLVGVKTPLGDNTQLFFQYQYGWIDGSSLRGAFDEANWFILGLEMKF